MTPRDPLRVSFAVALAAALPMLPRVLADWGPNALYDEGNTVVAAWRVLQGDRLYADVWQMHAPGCAWLLALVFRVAGTTLLVERLLKLGLGMLVAGLVFRLARRSGAPRAAAALAALFSSLAPPANPFLRPNDPAFAAGLGAALLVLAAPGARAAAPAGLLLGLAAGFRLDFGAYACAAIVLHLVLARRLPDAFRVLGGGTLAILPFAAVLALQGVTREAWEQMFAFPAASYRPFRGLPFFDPLSIAIPLGLAAAALVATWRRGDDAAATLRLAALTCLAYLAYARVRPDLDHTLPSRVCAAVVLAGLASLPSEPRARRLAGLGAAALLVLAVLPSLRTTPGFVQAAASLPSAGASRFGPWLRPPAALLERVRWLEAHSPAGGAVFAGNTRHDRVVMNDVLVYFLAGRRSVTRYYNLHPGLATEDAVQAEIAAALEEQRPPLLLWRAPLWDEPNLSGSPRATRLDAAIRARYREAAAFGAFSGWLPVD